MLYGVALTRPLASEISSSVVESALALRSKIGPAIVEFLAQQHKSHDSAPAIDAKLVSVWLQPSYFSEQVGAGDGFYRRRTCPSRESAFTHQGQQGK